MTAVAESLDRVSPPRSDRRAWLQYSAGLVLFTGVLLIFLAMIHVRGGFVHPYLFFAFRRLFYLQYALFGGAVLASLLFLLPWRIGWLGRVLWFIPFHLVCVWLVLWCLVHRTFGIELTADTVIAVLTNQAPIATMGVNARELAWTISLGLLITFALTAVTEFAYRKYDLRIRRRLCGIAVVAFLIVHIPTRAYFAYQIDHNAQVALAFDDCVPFPLRTERLLERFFKPRISLPNYESPKVTQKYFDYLRSMAMPAVPRRRNILWINVESLRFDALNEATMPQLWRYRNCFQIRLNEQHWSGGNVTHFAVFSELTGLSGFFLKDFRRRGMTMPLFRLLLENDYQVRIADKDHLDSADLSRLVPAGVEMVDIDTPDYGGDEPVTDAYLTSRMLRSSKPSFDFIAYDATHWPYSFPDEDAIFQPAPPITTTYHMLLSETELESIRNRYQNSCHFVDSQIGRVLADLEGRGGFNDTVVIVVGDHGEEFQERGQITHSAVLNDFQARTVLWMHFPDESPEDRPIDQPTLHNDILPTLLHSLGFKEDVLYTQGSSLLGPVPPLRMLSLCEQGWAAPIYRAFVTGRYISRWRYRPSRYLFSGVQRRDGNLVQGSEWLEEVRALYPEAARMYDVLPDVSQPPHRFDSMASVFSAN